MAHDDPTRRMMLMRTMARDGVEPDAAPDQRLGADEKKVYQSQLEGMIEALRPLAVGLDEDGQEGTVEIIGRLGEGGMGIVELAVQRALGREVALKRMLVPPTDLQDGYPLLDEARILGGLEHPNIVPVHAVGIDPELGPVVLLKRVQGVTWAEELSDDSEALPDDPRTLEKHLRILMQVCNALHFAHSRGIIHRDIKPDNVMLGAYGEVYLLDWGLALDTNSLRPEKPVIAGTASYMAPEMVEGDVTLIDARSDVYLLGATLHQVLTGVPRHGGQTVLSCVTQAAMSKPAKYGPEVPSDLAAICNAACARDKKARFPTAEHLHQAIADYIERREALRLLDAAREALVAAGEEPQRATRRIYEARFAAEQALRTAPGMSDAKRMRTRCLHAAIRHELERGNLASAADLIEELDTKLPVALADLLELSKREAAEERARIERMERDVDPEFSRLQRLRFGVLGLIVLALYYVGFYWLYPVSEGELTPLTFLVANLLLVAPLAGPLIFSSGKLRETAVGRQFGWILVAALTAIVAAALIGWLGDLPMPTIFAFECALVSMIPLAVDVPFRGRVIASLFGLGMAMLCVAKPIYARQIHTAWHLLLLCLAVADNAVPQKNAFPQTTASEKRKKS